MKRYFIGITLLLALMNTGCEDAKAESKDYDVEIAELQQQITQLSSRLDSTISMMPTRKIYTGEIDSDGNISIDIPEIKLDDMPSITVLKEYLSGDNIGDYGRSGLYWKEGNGHNRSSTAPQGQKYIVIIVK